MRAALTGGAATMAAAVAAGAFGAHALRGRLDPAQLALWETAARYAVIGAIGMMVTALAAPSPAARAWRAAFVLLAAGTLVFAGTVGALALGGPRWLGAVTPLGGLGLIAGYVVLAVTAARRRQQGRGSPGGG